jgi:hypothetical protein
MPEGTLIAEASSQRADLSKEVIQYLSKEIETTTNTMMVFRSKMGFAVLVGPFLILGTLVYSAKGLQFSTHFGAWGIIAICVDIFCYLGLAFATAKIEEDAWRHCDRCRKLISDLHADPTLEIGNKNAWKDPTHVNWMKWSYLLVCTLLIISFISSVYVISRVRVETLPTLAAPTAAVPTATLPTVNSK